MFIVWAWRSSWSPAVKVERRTIQINGEHSLTTASYGGKLL